MKTDNSSVGHSDNTPGVKRCRVVPNAFLKILCISLVTLVLIAGFTNLSPDQFKYHIFMPTRERNNHAESISSRLLSYCPQLHSSSSSPSPPSSPKKAGKVLLMTYGRSGSTFTSALISHHKDVFYTYEPLFIHKTSKTTVSQNNSMPILDEYLTCNFTREYIYALINSHNRNSPDTSRMYSCVTQLKGAELLTCYAGFQANCQQKDVKFVKTIRSRIKWAEWFLKTYPDFYLLYLVRDPRATIASQVRTFGVPIDRTSTQICVDMKQDVAAAERLKSLYPDRVMGIRYENGALNPFQYTKDIYKFLGLDYDETTEKYITSLTNHDPKDRRTQHAYSVVRANSTKTMNKWRQIMKFQWVNLIDRLCGAVYSKLGYRAVMSEEDLRSDKPLITEPERGSVFEK